MRAYNPCTDSEEDLEDLVVQMPTNPRFVVTIPHCGLYFPDDFPRRFVIDNLKVDDTDVGAEAIYDLTDIGGIVIKSRVHRNTLDLNRIPEVDRNFKRINRKTGQEKYLGPDLTPEEETVLLRKYYNPFYSAIRKAMKLLKDKYGRAVLINGHTFSLGLEQPGICVGDNRGFCSPEFKYSFIEALEGAFRKENKSGVTGLDYPDEQRSGNLYRGIGIDYPFDGTDGPSQRFGKPKNGYDAFLIEFSRELFVDPTDNKELFVGLDMKSVDTGKLNIIRRRLSEAIDYALRTVYKI